MRIRTMLRVLRFRIDWTPIAWGILASIKVRDACDNMVLIDFDRFMKQIVSAHFAVFEMAEQSGLVFLRAVHLTGQCTTALLITA